eukprot:CAMPEP_0174292272 /NCGR_PEP_ID=MMETSP0809-20121228/34876_1 /TAXON_ID=73025 ORGANISM="Eutreptiella gymnastica-like, Strain CCMP1594" /NCGR_SAMPLE_ID=MMETSP0809 /ASSEMBLY_ACC=CAM_ASM_000658 /LENGTH=145 /DNA_ID=CAMNT_0015392223 /DNA_START=120 /DNA_END=554 /DNA_ORIENTATION=-
MEIIVPDLPLFNKDVEDAGAPASVIAFREALKKADAFVFATCEYNFSLSAAMKNALDWGSRGDGGNLFDDKPAAVVSAGGGTGGLRAQQHIRDIALFLNLHFMNKAEVQLKIFTNPSPFDSATGDLVHEESVARCEKSLHALIEW